MRIQHGSVTAQVIKSAHAGYIGWIVELSDPHGFRDIPGVRTSARTVTQRGAERRALRMIRKVIAERKYQIR